METSKKNQIECGLGGKFGPNYVQCHEKVKKHAISLGFFSYFTWGLPSKARISGCEITEWKFMAIKARNAKF